MSLYASYAAEDTQSLIKLGANENPFGPSPLALAAMQRALLGCNYYQEPENLALEAALAAHFGLAPQQLIVTSSMSDLLLILCRALLGPGLNAVGGDLSFFLYPLLVKSVGAELRCAPMPNYTYDLDAIAAAINADTRVVLLSNPNNPTGTMFDAAALDRFLDKVPERVIIALDEAYYDFATEFARRRGITYSHGFAPIADHPNLIVMRTFSKAHGLAAIRCGFGAAHPDLIARIKKFRTPFSVSGVAQAGALASLQDLAHIQKAVRNNADEAPRVAGALAQMGFAPVPTSSNFLFLEVGRPAAEVDAALFAEGISVRPMAAWGATTAIRVTIGTPEQNDAFLAAFRKVI